MSRARSAEQRPDDREQTTEDSKSQRSEVRGQRSEQPDDRGQRTEDSKSQRAEVGDQRTANSREHGALGLSSGPSARSREQKG